LQLSCIRFGTLGPFIKTNHVSTWIHPRSSIIG
jgi:hypothetical protein